jgi:diguanylate cyclase (GGDEF)-like protein
MIYLSIVIPYGLDLVLHRAALWDSDRGLLMMNLFCAHPVYIVTLSGIATLKTHIMQAGLQADALRVAASVDYLTGVANRRATTQVLESAFEQACASSIAISVVLLDIDHFKTINDTRGHAVGDTALVQVCTILQQHLRASDVLGRWGGEEFLIVASATSSFEAVQVAERLRAVIATHSFDQVGQVTASFGVATSLPQDTPEALVKRADEALYRAKQSGRNRVELAPGFASLEMW